MARAAVDLRTTVGTVILDNPILSASGTAGYGPELARYGDLSELGAVVVKSLAAQPWAGNRAPRVHELRAGMINSVGLQGPGVAAWRAESLPALVATGARVVASIWGSTVDDYAQAAQALVGAQIAAVEVNVSCPNLHDGSRMFSHSVTATAEAVEASQACGAPLWVKLSPAIPELIEIASGALHAGAAALVLTNTVPGIALDIEARRPILGAGGGGVSGPALHPIAVRAVWECAQGFPEVPIVGVGGVVTAADAIEFLMAGASAVEVGTATFRDPKAPWRLLRGVERWCRRHGVRSIGELIGAAHG